MSNPLAMLSFFVVIALWGCQPTPEGGSPEGGSPETSAPEAAEPGEMLATPFTAEQIRDEWIEEFSLLMQKGSPSGGTLERWTVLAADEEGVEIEFAPVNHQGEAAGDPQRSRSTWEALRDHAAFPAALASREEAIRETPLGQLDGWLYKVRGEDGGETEYFFAKSLPGAPVQMRVTQDDTLILEMTQIERHRPQQPEKQG